MSLRSFASGWKLCSQSMSCPSKGSAGMIVCSQVLWCRRVEH
ncbi:MAG: hypothetical protein ACHQAV_05160 [Solirubrobacterales bacterium]